MQWHSFVTDFGFPIALVLFFVWAAWKREERQERNSIDREQRIATRVTDLERFMQTELLDMNRAAVTAITDNTAALRQLIQALDTRPCLVECEGSEVSRKLDLVLERVASSEEKET